MEKKEPILVVKDLKQHFKINRNFTVKAVDGISFDIMPGETYGLVGESGFIIKALAIPIRCLCPPEN